jgi:thiosulfate/3-mercaptopyruvate sulfurtransferase
MSPHTSINIFRRLGVLLMLIPLGIWANELRISTEAISKQLDGNTVLLDTRRIEDYQLGHLPGALSFPVSLTYRNQEENGQIVQPDSMQALLRERGIDIDTPVVIYDDGTLLDAARLFWALEVYGLSHVRVMEQGFDHWQNMNLPISQQVPSPQPSTYVATINHKRLASKFNTLLATRNASRLIIDARSRNAYLGKESSAKRYGHIPMAISIPSIHNFTRENDSMRIKPIAELKKLYASVPRDQRVIVYCAIGRASSANYLALRELGLDVANYDASWKEWGNDSNLPIEK